MLDDCITKLQELDRRYSKVNEITPAMHEEFEKALIELLQHSVTENQRAITTIKKLQNELVMTRCGLKTPQTGLQI
jgi:hypothetical protein